MASACAWLAHVARLVAAGQSFSENVLLLQVGQTNHERRAVRAEKQMARLTLVPVLQAEEDRRCAHCTYLLLPPLWSSPTVHTAISPAQPIRGMSLGCRWVEQKKKFTEEEEKVMQNVRLSLSRPLGTKLCSPGSGWLTWVTRLESCGFMHDGMAACRCQAGRLGRACTAAAGSCRPQSQWEYGESTCRNRSVKTHCCVVS